MNQPDPNTILPANSVPLISREEHLLGEKLLNLETKWGEGAAVKIRPVNWLKLRKITAQGLSEDEQLQALLKESLGEQSNILDHLMGSSLGGVLIPHVLAFCFGEKPASALKKTMSETNQTPTGLPIAGAPGANSSPPDGTAQKSADIQSSDSALNLNSCSESKPETTNAS